MQPSRSPSLTRPLTLARRRLRRLKQLVLLVSRLVRVFLPDHEPAAECQPHTVQLTLDGSVDRVSSPQGPATPAREETSIMTTTTEIEQLASELVAQWQGRPACGSCRTTITLSGQHGYLVFYELTWRPRVEKNELGLPEVVVEAESWRPLDPSQPTTQEFAESQSCIVESASRLLWPAVQLLWERGHAVEHRGPQHRFPGWRISTRVTYATAP